METQTPIKPFPLTHVALYAKNWYKRTDNIWADLSLCLEADGFVGYDGYEHRERCNMALLIYHKVMPLLPANRFDEFIRSISPQECWKVGFYTKDHTWYSKSKFVEYEYWQAVVMTLLSMICSMEASYLGLDKETFKPTIPELKKDAPQEQPTKDTKYKSRRQRKSK